jgi:hypothetical protein
MMAQAQKQMLDVSPSPGWADALPPPPDTRVKITEEYARHVARDAFFWAWPMVNVFNKRLGRSWPMPGRCLLRRSTAS